MEAGALASAVPGTRPAGFGSEEIVPGSQWVSIDEAVPSDRVHSPSARALKRADDRGPTREATYYECREPARGVVISDSRATFPRRSADPRCDGESGWFHS